MCEGDESHGLGGAFLFCPALCPRQSSVDSAFNVSVVCSLAPLNLNLVKRSLESLINSFSVLDDDGGLSPDLQA